MYSLSLSVATFRCVVFLNIRQLKFHQITILTSSVILFLKRYLFVVVVMVSLIICCTLSYCSVSTRICVQSGRVEMEYGGGDKYENE